MPRNDGKIVRAPLEPTMKKLSLSARATGALATLCVVLTGLVACSESSTGDDLAGGVAGKYALLTRVTDASSTRTDYVVLTDSLDDAERTLSLDQAIELPAGARLFKAEKDDTFFVEDIPLLRKFEVDSQGKIQEVGSMSFAARGIPDQGAAYVTVLGPNKAYLVSNAALKVVVFDPSSLEITGEFAIPLQEEEYPARFSFGEPVLRDGKLVFSTWVSDTTVELVSEVSHVIVLDTQTDSVAAITRDTRCGGLINVLQAANGSIYFFPDVWTAAIHRLGAERAPRPCLLRMSPGQIVPDADYAPLLSDFTGMEYSAGALAAGGNSFYVFGLDEASANITETSTAQVLHSGPWWRWYRVDIETIEPGVPGELLGGTHYGWALDGRNYTYTASDDGSESTVLRVDQAGAPVSGTRVPGTLNKAVQLH